MIFIASATMGLESVVKEEFFFMKKNIFFHDKKYFFS